MTSQLRQKNNSMKLININTKKMRSATALLLASAAVALVPACNQLDNDDHYKNNNTVINNPELNIVNQTSEDYIASRADFSKMSELFKTYGIYDQLAEKGQLATILMVTNEDMAGARADDEISEYVVRSHVSDVSVSPSNLHDGDRLMMWHGKFVNISMDEEGKAGSIIDHVQFNNAYVKEVIQTSNGYIYVISDMIQTPTSLYDYITGLSEEYSIFKELVLSSGGKEFDRANSKPIGVNAEGNTVYDSVFIVTNAHFDAVGMDLNSEALTATMILPSDAVIKEAMDDAHRRLQLWNMERDDAVLMNWILDVAFYNKRYTVEDLDNTAEPKMVKSVFSKQWKTDAHKLIAGESEELSNGVVLKASKLHIPNNVLVYRLQSHFYLYELCDDAQKDNYFKMSNMTFKTINDDGGYTPLATLWPFVSYRCLTLAYGNDGKDSSYRLDFTPIRSYTDENGVSKVETFLIPPGSYKLTFGSKQNCGQDVTASVLVGGNVVAVGAKITLGSSTTYHYDRGAGGYPEGYDANAVKELTGDSKTGNYSRDGGPLIDEVVIPDLNGDGSAVPIVIRFDGTSWQNDTFIFHSWCLKPTADNY